MRERNIAILGNFNSVTQSLMQNLTEAGADVVLICEGAEGANRFCQNLTDQREVKSSRGRAGAINADFSRSETIKEALSQGAQRFGSIDMFVDLMVGLEPTLRQEKSDKPDDWDLFYQRYLKSTLLATDFVVPFFKNRKRGRVLFISDFSGFHGFVSDFRAAALRTGLRYYAQVLAKELAPFNITANSICIGPSEDFLIKRFPQAGSAQAALEQFKAQWPNARILDSEKLSQTILFLLDHSGAGLTGQHFEVGV